MVHTSPSTSADIVNYQCLPNLVVIGAMKGGTSSLHRYLNLHPQIHMSDFKELDYFVKEKKWNRGLSWYQSKFVADRSSVMIRGESSPNYTKYPAFSGVPERMAQLIPTAKLIYLVRDPVKRVLSHYHHQYLAHCESRSLTEAFTHLDQNHYLNCSRYAMQLEQFLPYYSLDQILVISTESLSHDRLSTLQQIFRFLGVDPHFDHPGFSQVFHQSSQRKRPTNLGMWLNRIPHGHYLCNFLSPITQQKVELPPLSDALCQRLIEALQEDVDRLKALTGQAFPDWML
jgi:Sulfotransferase domain